MASIELGVAGRTTAFALALWLVLTLGNFTFSAAPSVAASPAPRSSIVASPMPRSGAGTSGVGAESKPQAASRQIPDAVKYLLGGVVGVLASAAFFYLRRFQHRRDRRRDGRQLLLPKIKYHLQTLEKRLSMGLKLIDNDVLLFDAPTIDLRDAVFGPGAEFLDKNEGDAIRAALAQCEDVCGFLSPETLRSRAYTKQNKALVIASIYRALARIYDARDVLQDTLVLRMPGHRRNDGFWTTGDVVVRVNVTGY